MALIPLWACVSGWHSAALAASRQLDIAVVCPLTKPSSAFAIGHLQGISLAVGSQTGTDWNINLQIFDDQEDPQRAKQIIRNLASSSTVAVLGPCNSTVAEAVIADLRDTPHSLPIITSTTTATSLTQASAIGEPPPAQFFRMNVADRKRVRELISAALDRFGARNVAIIYEKNDAYGEGLLADAKNILGEPAFKDRVALITKNHSRVVRQDQADAIAKELREANFIGLDTAVFLFDLSDSAMKFLTAIQKTELGVQIYTVESNHKEFEGLPDEGRLAANGARHISAFDPTSKSTNPFFDKFSKKFGTQPDFAAALSYDAMQYLLRALELVRKEKGDLADTETIRTALLEKLPLATKDGAVKAVISGDHQLDGGEYTDLNFQGLQFWYDRGDLKIISWEDPVREPVRLPSTQAAPRPPIPNMFAAMILYISAFLGSILFHTIGKDRDTSLIRRLKSAPWLSVVVFEPLGAFVVFGLAYVLALFSAYTTLVQVGSQPGGFELAAFTIGVLTGLIGLALVHAVANKILGFFDIEISSK